MNAGDPTPRVRTIPARVHGRYLVQAPEPAEGVPGWLVGFHGYGHNAERHLAQLCALQGAGAWLVASVQALHPFYVARTGHVVASWMTRLDRDLAIADNVAYVDGVLAGLEQEFGAPNAIVLVGFSQGVAMAYRAALLGAHPVDAIVAVAGDVPPELKTPQARPWPLVLVAAGTADDYYTTAKLEQDVELLRTAGADVRPIVFDGGHEWSPVVVEAAGRLLAELAGRAGTRARPPG